MVKIKKGDTVKVMRGKEAGKTGEVLAVVRKVTPAGADQTKIVVQGVNKVKRHMKPNVTLNIPGGIVEIEKAMDISNVMLIDAKTGKPTRVGIKVEDGKKVRIAKKSKTVIK